ncbi:conserved membrane hypothetical protein [Xanthomonas phaseoli pv. phaseoli]|uniref:Uncharacterized protein n=1 Tax=Xanthomonas campestris pv. phaseoli TaxID=317013 RepID=A0AB38E3R4_XANCH|nr:conserved membrane hypothetical protein [Xanthomonas phaseoli pv. phaseoli]SON88352.1 conserved membrane hypothetical protein [Xanthomonas phaseoli pv. phaseoli]SON91746.1 conserved membrane hypothetical protein [Xanthomonas phaseoli pv. phaseoli]
MPLDLFARLVVLRLLATAMLSTRFGYGRPAAFARLRAWVFCDGDSGLEREAPFGLDVFQGAGLAARFFAAFAVEVLFFAAVRLDGAFLVAPFFSAARLFAAAFLVALLATLDDAVFLAEALAAAVFFVARLVGVVFFAAVFFADVLVAVFFAAACLVAVFFTAVFFEPPPLLAPLVALAWCRRAYTRAAQRWPAPPPQSSQAI